MLNRRSLLKLLAALPFSAILHKAEASVPAVILRPIFGKTDEPIARKCSGIVSVWSRQDGDAFDTLEKVTAYSHWPIAGDRWVTLMHNGNGWFVSGAEC